MAFYVPDRWILVRITTTTGNEIVKVFCGWLGGYLNGDVWGDSWQLVYSVRVIEEDSMYSREYFDVRGVNGSLYRLHLDRVGVTGYMNSILDGWLENLEGARGLGVMPIQPLTREESIAYLQSVSRSS